MALVMLISYMPATVWAVDADTDITAIEKPTGLAIVEDYDDYFGDNWESELSLPGTVKVTLADGSKADAAVTWDTSVLDTRTTGYYSIPGEVTLPAGATNSQNLKATITVQVREYKNLIANGDFENGTTGWKGWTLSAVTDPTNSANKVLFAKTSSIKTTSGGGQIIYQKDDATINALVAAFEREGAGQYYFAIDAMSAPYDASSTARTDIDAWVNLRYNTNGTNSNTSVGIDTDKIRLSATEWTTLSEIGDMQDAWNWLRSDVVCKGSTATAAAVYIDNVQLVPLKVPLKAEPASITEIKTEILSRKVVLNYPDYVGEGWKTELGLPASVEVLTDNGSTVEVDVTWSFAGLDFTKYGKYTLVGTLDDSSFPNPKGLTAQQNIYVVKERNALPNGGFETDLSNWKGWTLSAVTDPIDSLDKVLYAKTSAIKTASGGGQIIFQRDDAATGALLDSITTEGAGQYYFAVDAMSAPYDANTPARTDIETWINLRYNTNGSSSNTSVGATTDHVTLSTTKWTTLGTVVTIESAWNWLRSDAVCRGLSDGAAAVYLDDFQLIPLNVTIAKGEEPAEIEEVISELPVHAVVVDYDKYVGANWQTALGLPEQVEVRTANGGTALVDVSWNYDALNLKKVGKYVLTGTLDNSSYPNPKELFVTQIIYIREYKNLIPNPDFESGTEGWYLKGSGYTRVTSPVHFGQYAGVTGTFTPRGQLDESLADTRNMTDSVGEAVALQGAGQYYYSLWAQATPQNLAEGMRIQTRFLYKTKDADGNLSDSTTKKSDFANASNKNYVQSANVVELPANVGWVRIDLYYIAKAVEDLNGIGTYIDHAELIPLNVLVDRYEGEMEEVETVIPTRQIVQNYHEYIGAGYTVADLLLPETVDVRSTKGEIVRVGVSWNYSTLDLTKTGTYTVTGALEEIRLDNPKALTVKQSIKVVSYKNLLTNPSFEDYGDNWRMSAKASSELGIMTPVKDGSLAMQIRVGRLEEHTIENLQSMWSEDVYDMGLRITASGEGRYYFGGWAQGDATSTDMQFYTRFWYRSYENGDSSLSYMSPRAQLNTKEYVSSGSIVTLPGDLYWARMDVYVAGTIPAMRNSSVYVDHLELIPLNVEVPYLTDIMNCETVPDAYAHQGTKFEDLGLPEKLEVTLKSGQYFNIGVIWDKASYDPNKLGEQVITGQLDLGTKYKNTKNFTPTVVVTVRAKGEDLRQTIYISNSGSEANDGLSPNSPKKEITNIPTYLAQGYNVRLKKGDTWYIPTGSLTFNDLHGTEDAPLMITSYGEGAKPIIGFMMKIEKSAWTLVDAKRNVYSADVSAFGQKNGESVHRCFVNDEAYFHKSRNNYVSLEEEEFCSYNNRVYIRMPAGEAPDKVEVTPQGSGGIRINIQYVSYLTFEDIHIKGGSSVFPIVRIDAPTKYLKFTHIDMTHTWYYQFYVDANDERINYKPEWSYMYMDSMTNEKEGSLSGYYESYWDPHAIEGYSLHDGVEGAWIHHNHVRQMSHGFITICSDDKDVEYTTRGVYDCILEDNVFEGGNNLYTRALNLSGGFNLNGIQMARNNIFRRNKCYDLTVSSHLYGENNLVYSNVYSYSHTTYNEDGTLFDGKSAQPWGFDTIPWKDHGSVGNIVVNNTFYDVTGVIAVYDQAMTVYNNIYANNLVVNWEADAKASRGTSGAFYDNTIGLNYFMHNGLFDMDGDVDHFTVDGKIYSAEDVNNSITGYKGNIYANPKFVNVDMTLLGKRVRQDFTLSGESPMRYAGLSLYDPVYQNFPMWEELVKDYTDINGVVYLAESPSIGAYSYSELITGDVAEVGQLADVLCRPGATVDQLMLPDSVPAVNDAGIDVVLLVTWNTASFDSSKPGTITLTGELRNGPHTDLNINGKTATININVKDKLELMNIVTRVDLLTVLYGTTFEGAVAQLPGVLHVVEESGFEEDLPVIWTCEDYDGNKPGDYTFQCVLPEDKISNTREFDLEVTVRVMHELGRGVELLINPDFVDGSSAAPWALGWLSGQYGNYRITTDPELLPEGEAGGAIITVSRRYASLQQDVTGQMQLMGDGKYLFRVKMRAFDANEPIDSSYPCLQQLATTTVVYRCRPKKDIGTEYVEFYQIMDVRDVMSAQSFAFHTSTGKSLEDAEDGPRSYIIAGCSLVYLGKTDAEVEATLDSMDLTWNLIKGDNTLDQANVMTNLNLPTKIGSGSTIKWTSSDESVITNDGKVTMGRVPQVVTLTATITYKGKETVKKFQVTVPRDPALPTFSGCLTGSQTAQVGDEIDVTIKLNAENATTFNAYRFTLSFNVSRLEYVKVSDPASTVELDNGRITISSIGAERPITDTITVTFKVKKSGTTEVKLVQMEMDNDPNASLDNLPIMTVTEGTALIDVQKTEGDKQEGNSNITVGTTTEKEDSTVIYIVIAIVSAALIAGGAIVIILIKKKKQTPPATEE